MKWQLTQSALDFYLFINLFIYLFTDLFIHLFLEMSPRQRLTKTKRSNMRDNGSFEI